MISKELLSEILDLDVLAICGEQGGELKYWFDESCGNQISRESKINVDTLARLCKEWCYDIGVANLTSWIGDNTKHAMFYDGFDEHSFEADTEAEAIFKATQWVKDNK